MQRSADSPGGNLKAHSIRIGKSSKQPVQLLASACGPDPNTSQNGQHQVHQHTLYNIQQAQQSQAMLQTDSQIRAEALQPLKRFKLRQSLQAPLSGPEMFTPVPAAARPSAVAVAAAAGAGADTSPTAAKQAALHAAAAWVAADGSPGRTRSRSSSPQAAALRAAAATCEQLQHEWKQQEQDRQQQQQQQQLQEHTVFEHRRLRQSQQLEERYQQQQHAISEAAAAAKGSQSSPRQQQPHAADSAAKLAASLKLTPELHQQLMILQKQRQLQQRYQRTANQQYALRARTPSPLRSTSPTEPPPRSLTPPRQAVHDSGAVVAAAPTAAAAAAGAARFRGGKTYASAAPRASAASAAQAAAASAARGPGAVVDIGQPARTGKPSAGSGAARKSSKHSVLASSNSAGLSLRSASRAGTLTGTHASSRPVTNSSSRSGSAAAGTVRTGSVPTAAALGAAKSRVNGAPSAAAKAPAVGGSRGAHVRAVGQAHDSKAAAAQSAARVAVAAGIEAEAGTLGYKTGSQGQMHIAAVAARQTAAVATGGRQPAAAAAGDDAAGLLSRGSKLQQLKHCNQRLRQTLQQKQQLQPHPHMPHQQDRQQQHQAQHSSTGTNSLPAAELPQQDSAHFMGAAADHAVHPMYDSTNAQPASQLQQHQHQGVGRWQVRQSGTSADDADASEARSPPLEHSSSSSQCSEAVHELEHWQHQHHQQQQQQQPDEGYGGPQAMLVQECSGGSSAGDSPGSDSFLRNEQAAMHAWSPDAPALAAEGCGSSCSNLQQQQRPGAKVVRGQRHGFAAAVAACGVGAVPADSHGASRSGSEDGDTGSSISFMVAQLAGAPQQQQQHQQGALQPQEQQHQEEASNIDWPPRKHLRTALFSSPAQEPQHDRQRGRPQDGTRDSLGSSSNGSSSPACSWLQEDDEDAADAAEQQMQLLLNNTARQGPESPSWTSNSKKQANQVPTQAAARQQQQQQQRGQAEVQGGAGAGDRRMSIGGLLSRTEEDFLQLLEGVQEEGQAASLANERSSAAAAAAAAAAAGSAAGAEGDQLGKIMQQQADLYASHRQQQQQHQQLQQEGSGNSQGVLNLPPWRPPGVTASISSPPPPIRAERSAAGGSGSAQQQRMRNASSSRSRSRSPVHTVTAVSAAGIRNSRTSSAQANVRSALQQRRRQLQQWEQSQLRQEQAQQKPDSYQVQLQAYLDAQQQQQLHQGEYLDADEHGQQKHGSDKQQPDQQHSKHWQQRGSPGRTGSSPKATSGRKASLSPQQQQQQQEVRYRLSLPESCEGSEGDAMVDWAAAALDAAAGKTGGLLDQQGFEVTSSVAAAAAVDPDAVAEEFAALLESGPQPAGWAAAQPKQCLPRMSGPEQQQQQQQGQQDDPQLEAWGSKVDVGRPNSGSSSSGTKRNTEASYQKPQAQQEAPKRGLSAGKLRKEDSEQEQLRAMCRAVDAAISQTAVAFRQYWLQRRAFTSWSRRCGEHARSKHLLREANRASADAFAATRQQRLLSHCWSGWTAAVVVGSSARSAATQLLQRTLQRQVLGDWRLVAFADRATKQEVLRAWGAQVQEHQADRLQLEIADLHHYQLTLQKAWRAWVVAWCKAASARVLAAQFAAKRKAAVLSALADNAAYQRQKRAALLRADTFRRARLLLLCVRWWKGWAHYSRVLQSAGAEVQASARERVLREVLAAWQGYACFRVWKAEAIEAAEGFYWSRLATTVLGAWRREAADASSAAAAAEGFATDRQRRLLAAMLQEWQQWAQASCMVDAFLGMRKQRLLQACTQEWWVECVGNKRAFELQVQGLVRLVTVAFKAWRGLVAERRQQQREQLELLVQQAEEEQEVPAESSGSRVGGEGGSNGGSSSGGSLIAQYTHKLQQRRQQQQQYGQRSQQQEKEELDVEHGDQLLRQVVMGWCGFVGLRKMWRSEAPLLAAAYYQARLLKRVWGAWAAAVQQQQQQGQYHNEEVPDQEEWDGVVRVDQEQQQWQLEQQREESCGTAESAVRHQHKQEQQQRQYQQQFEQEEGAMCGEESCSTVPCAEPSLQEILMCSSAAALEYHSHAVGSDEQQQQYGQCAPPPAAEEDSEGALCGAVHSNGGFSAPGKLRLPKRGNTTAVMLVAAEADVDAWKTWQQQQHEQQLEAIQMTAAEGHYTAVVLRRVFAGWYATAAAGAALMSRQAQLKHAVQLQLVQVVKQQQLAAAHVRERLLERPFRCWMQVVLLKGSAASGFRSYQLLFKGFLGWREVPLRRMQQQEQQRGDHQQQQQQQVQASRHNRDRREDDQQELQQQLDLCLVRQPKQPRLPEAQAGQQQQQQHQEQQDSSWQAWGQQLDRQQQHKQPRAQAPPQQQQQQQYAVPAHAPVAAAVGDMPMQQRLGPQVVSAAAARVARLSAGGDEPLCQPVQLEDSACSIHHSVGALELTDSEAAFVEAHQRMARQGHTAAAAAAAQHAQFTAAGAATQQVPQAAAAAAAAEAARQQRVQAAARCVQQASGGAAAAAAAGARQGWAAAQGAGPPGALQVPLSNWGRAAAAGDDGDVISPRELAAARSHVLNVGVLRSPPVSSGGCDPAAAAAAAAAAAGAVGRPGVAGGSSSGAQQPTAVADVIAARLAGVLRQQQQLQQQQQGAPPAHQQQQQHQSRRQQQQQQDPGVEEDLRSSFGDFGCLQDLQNILETS